MVKLEFSLSVKKNGTGSLDRGEAPTMAVSRGVRAHFCCVKKIFYVHSLSFYKESVNFAAHSFIKKVCLWRHTIIW